jgi:hypothetical protein
MKSKCGWKIHEEMFIFCHQRNENPKYFEIPSHLSQKGNHQGNKQHMLVKKLGGKKPLYTVGITMEISVEVSQKVKNRTIIWFQCTIFGIHPKQSKSAYNVDTCTPMFITTLFTIAKL